MKVSVKISMKILLALCFSMLYSRRMLTEPSHHTLRTPRIPAAAAPRAGAALASLPLPLPPLALNTGALPLLRVRAH